MVGENPDISAGYLNDPDIMDCSLQHMYKVFNVTGSHVIVDEGVPSTVK